MNRASIPHVAALRQTVHRSEAQFGKLPWISKYLIHPYISIYFTRIFLQLGLSGLHVTILMMLCALMGSSLFAVGGTPCYLMGSALMLLSWVWDHSDGEVRRYRGEDASIIIYLDLFTHRVTYPLMHLGMGISLYRETQLVGYLLFGTVVAYFYQLVVSHGQDKRLIHLQRGDVDLTPLRTLRLRLTERFPVLEWPLKISIGLYYQFIQNNSFVVLLSLSALAGVTPQFYLIYGAVRIGHWVLTIVLDFTLAFSYDLHAYAADKSADPSATHHPE